MPKSVVLCPGQGAQEVGMGKDLVDASPECRDLFQQAADLLGVDFCRVCGEGPEPELTLSSVAQPAIFLVSVAATMMLRRRLPDLQFDAAAGLSSGEWTALYLAGVLSLEDALKALDARGRFMQESCESEPGGMISIFGLSVETLEHICEKTRVQLANLNSSQQTVLSGPLDAVQSIVPRLKEAGAKRVIPLNVAGAFHSDLMLDSAKKFDKFLDEISFHPPRIPVISNRTGTWHGDVASIRRRMVEQISSPVLWRKGMERVVESGIVEYWECGPGMVLTGLLKRIDKKAKVHTIHDVSSIEVVATARRIS